MEYPLNFALSVEDPQIFRVIPTEVYVAREKLYFVSAFSAISSEKLVDNLLAPERVSCSKQSLVVTLFRLARP